MMFSLRYYLSLFEDENLPPYHLVGTCVNAFDEDGNCLIPSLGWDTVSDFAVDEENATRISPGEFYKDVKVPDEILQTIGNHDLEFLYVKSTFILYDIHTDIHYFFTR